MKTDTKTAASHHGRTPKGDLGFQDVQAATSFVMKPFSAFLEDKRHLHGSFGFDALFVPDFLFDFQKHLVNWAVKKGRAAIFADCGMGKTPMQLVFAENVVRKTNKPVLLLTPLAVGAQTLKESEKFGIRAERCGDGNVGKAARVVIANYERLHLFNSEDFSGVVADESSILKNFDGVTKAAVIQFMRKLPYRLLCTATAAPNDYIELGNSSEALGDLGFMDMLGTFFKKAESTMSRSEEFRAGIYRFKGHAERDFWRWVVSWARAVRKPSDLGFNDAQFQLPKLFTREHVIESNTTPEGFLFSMPAVGLQEERAERRRTITERCEKAAEIANATGDAFVSWCHLNDESALLKKLIAGAEEVTGSQPYERKEELFEAFAAGQIRVMVVKPQIAAQGLNWQHCHRQTYFPSHSFEQWYQGVRRSWRFGQKHDVTIDMVTSEGERGVMKNLQRKAAAAERMFEHLVQLMNNELTVKKSEPATTKQEIPVWL